MTTGLRFGSVGLPLRRHCNIVNTMTTQAHIAVLIPCLNEASSIGHVVRDFRAALPSATIYVYDNNSSDATASVAHEAGAVVRRETLQGKGNVIRRMFADIWADAYVLVDGDGTYEATAVVEMLRLMQEQGFDMVVGTRASEIKAAYRPGHRIGNHLLTALVRYMFGNRVTDLLSGYRVLSHRFVKSFPALSGGFETETELTVHALELRMAIGEVVTAYKERSAGSISKLRTYRDGMRILRAIVILAKEERPLQFFSLITVVLLLGGIFVGVPVILDFIRTGLVPRLPSAVLATGLMLLAALALTCGLILDTVTRGRREMKRLFYLSVNPSGNAQLAISPTPPSRTDYLTGTET